MKNIADLLNEPGTTVAIVGATDNPAKYGNVIYKDLKGKGFTVFPVNPKKGTVDGDQAYGSLQEIPSKPTVVNLVVPPGVVQGILQQCLDLGLSNVWLQPGAESPKNLAFLKEHNFNYLANACIMIQSRQI